MTGKMWTGGSHKSDLMAIEQHGNIFHLRRVRNDIALKRISPPPPPLSVTFLGIKNDGTSSLLRSQCNESVRDACDHLTFPFTVASAAAPEPWTRIFRLTFLRRWVSEEHRRISIDPNCRQDIHSSAKLYGEPPIRQPRILIRGPLCE